MIAVVALAFVPALVKPLVVTPAIVMIIARNNHALNRPIVHH